MEAHCEGVAARIRQQVGGRLKDRLKEVASLVLMSFEQRAEPARHLGLGSISDHLEEVSQGLALALELDNLRRIEDFVEGDLLRQGVPAGLQTGDLLFALPEPLVDPRRSVWTITFVWSASMVCTSGLWRRVSGPRAG